MTAARSGSDPTKTAAGNITTGAQRGAVSRLDKASSLGSESMIVTCRYNTVLEEMQAKWAKEHKSLTDLAYDVRKFMVLAYPGLQDRTTEVLDRDSFLEALEDPEPIVHVQAQTHPTWAARFKLRSVWTVEAVSKRSIAGLVNRSEW